jgi:putative endonuclease
LGAFPRLRAARGSAELGRAGERAAADYLRKRGYEVVGAGFLARRGELDLVCVRRGELVVVEVKTRSGDAFGTPFEAVTAKKRRSLLAAAAEYRALSEWRGPIRFAVIGITLRQDGRLDMEFVEAPFV